MGPLFSRRRLLQMAILAAFAPRVGPVHAAERTVKTYAYEANVGVLFNLLTYTLTGTVTADIDQANERYRVEMNGSGPGARARTESRGIIREGRFMPIETRSSHTVRGRDNRVTVTYDYSRRVADYHVRAYTFLMGRQWFVDDVVRLPEGQHIDDLISATLNFAAQKLDVDADGAFRVTVVRRARPQNEGTDDVSPGGYRAELATARFRAAPDAASGRLTALLDLTGFSSWARPARPARIVFGEDRYLESVSTSLILGTTFNLQLQPTS